MSAPPSIGSSSHNTNTSPTWLDGIRRRDPAAWKRLTDLYGPLVYQWAMRAGLSRADAADVLQEVFLSVVTSIDLFSSAQQGTFRGWLWTITRNKVHDHFRRRRGAMAAGGSEAHWQLANLPEQWSDSVNEMSRTESHQLFGRALERIRCEFEPRTWHAFWRTVVEDADTSEVATELGLTANTVRQYRSRILRRLRQELGDS